MWYIYIYAGSFSRKLLQRVPSKERLPIIILIIVFIVIIIVIKMNIDIYTSTHLQINIFRVIQRCRCTDVGEHFYTYTASYLQTCSYRCADVGENICTSKTSWSLFAGTSKLTFSPRRLGVLMFDNSNIWCPGLGNHAEKKTMKTSYIFWPKLGKIMQTFTHWAINLYW